MAERAINTDNPRVPYRAQPRRLRSSRISQRNSGQLRRLALLRMRARPRHTGVGFLPVVALLSALLIGGVVVGGVAAAGGAAAVTIDYLSEGLPDVNNFEQLDFAQPSVVYDRTGTVELARFQSERRRVVSYDEIPPLVLDATIAVEDRSFWENEGYDPNAIVSALIEAAAGGRERGASTITQQFVRARLLPEDVLQEDTYTRKAKEIIQAARLTAAFPGEAGKERIITAYLNQIYYGHNAYGIAAAAQIYFGITDLNQLTPAQAALLAGLPQSPTDYDLFKVAQTDALGRLVVPVTAAPGSPLPTVVARRNYILQNLAAGHGRWTTLTDEQLDQALSEPIVLAQELPTLWRAPHFIWHLKPELDGLLGSMGRPPADRGGYTIITSLDLNAQALAERYITAAAIDTQLPKEEFDAAIAASGLEADSDWLSFLRGKDIHNAALVAMDARTGDILAYVGSAGYYRNDLATSKLEPKFDVAGQGYRQPGSAWKPIEYAAGFDAKKITPGTLFLDTTAEFEPNWVPRDSDLKERGPVLARDALYYSLNDTAIRLLDRVGVETVDSLAQRVHLTYPRSPRQILQAGLAGAIGTVEVNMLQYTAAFASMGNSGVYVPPRSILEIRDSAGELIYHSGQPQGEQVISPQAAFLVSDILKGNTDPAENPQFGPLFAIDNGPEGERRPAAIKTGTTNDLRDLSAYGFVAPPADPSAPQLMVGVWMGNSDHSPPASSDQVVFASSGPGQVWRSFVRDYTNGQPLAQFTPPATGLVQADIDAWSGGLPGPWTTQMKREWFIAGTEPGAKGEIDPAGLLYRQDCGIWFVDITQVEPNAPSTWLEADRSWMARARIGEGVRGKFGTTTAYLRERESWGGTIMPQVCFVTPSPPPTLPPGVTPPPPITPPPGQTPHPHPTPAPEPTPKPKPTHKP
jgi:peptidoglycan glycosyltransferase